MKRLFILFVMLLIAEDQLYAQARTAPAYWVVETNTYTRDHSIVKFYDDQNNLVHEVKIDGMHIDIRKAKHRKKLDNLLGKYNNRLISASKKNKSKTSI